MLWISSHVGQFTVAVLRVSVIVIGKNLLLDLQRKLYIIIVTWQVRKGR